MEKVLWTANKIKISLHAPPASASTMHIQTDTKFFFFFITTIDNLCHSYASFVWNIEEIFYIRKHFIHFFMVLKGKHLVLSNIKVGKLRKLIRISRILFIHAYALCICQTNSVSCPNTFIKANKIIAQQLLYVICKCCLL